MGKIYGYINNTMDIDNQKRSIEEYANFNSIKYEQIDNINILINEITTGDLVIIASISSLSKNMIEAFSVYNKIRAAGATVEIIDLQLMTVQSILDNIGTLNTEVSERNETTIMGRPSIDFPHDFEVEYENWKSKKQTARYTMNQLGLKKSTFYNLVKKYEENKK